jgi:hypothetical protein
MNREEPLCGEEGKMREREREREEERRDKREREKEILPRVDSELARNAIPKATSLRLTMSSLSVPLDSCGWKNHVS